MVQRTSQELSINSGTVGVQQSGAGNATPDFNKFATNEVFDAPTPAEQGIGSRILASVMSAGDKLAGQKISMDRKDAYLDGMAKAGTIQSEAELNASPLMRDWQVAGYRDTMGRVAAADTEASIAADMVKNRELSPEKFADYLAQKRNELMPQWEGMTQQTRQAMFSQQLLNERAWIKKQQVEHYKFGVETETRSIKAAVSASLGSLDAAKDDAGSYATQSDATFGVVYSSIVANPKLPIAMKGKLIGEMATYALENDHQQLYQMIHNKAVPMPDGKEHPMSDLLGWDEDVALSKANRESMQRTEVFRNADWGDRKAKMEADWENPNTPLMPIGQVEALAQDGMQRKTMNLDQYAAFKKTYYEKAEKKVVQGTLANAYVAGDQNAYLHLGKTSDEALSAYVDVLGRKMQLPQVVDNLLTIGGTTGQGNAYKKVGQLMAPAFAQIGNSDKIDPANAVAVSGVLQRIDKAEKDGKSGAFSQFLSAFDPEVQSKITLMRDNLAKGNDPTTAIAAATAQVLEDSKLTPAVRAELAAAKSKEIVKALDDVTPRGWLDTGWLYAKSFIGTQRSRANASAELATTPYHSWLENEDRVNEVAASTKFQLAQSMDEIAKANPHMATDSVVHMAKADVANRTVPTDWGPLTVPKGFTPQRYFGVGQDVGNERIASALAEFIKPSTDGGRMAFRIGVNGELMYQELNAKGRPAAPAHTIDPKSIAPMVQAQRDRIAESFKLDHGEGVTVKQNGISVNFNGDNTANVDNGWMRRVRQDLVGHEGIRDSVYKDANGNDTIGVGSLVKPGADGQPANIKVGPDGKVTPAQISETFVRESDRAAQTATRIMGGTGLKSEAAFKLYTSLAYQSGNGFSKLKSYEPLMRAIVSKDPNAAMSALKASPAYRSSQPERQQYYASNLIAAMKG